MTVTHLVHGVIAAAPSSVVNVGIPDISRPAWSLRGQPVPHATVNEFGNPAPRDPAAVIPVEKIAGPAATLCGDDDHLWPSCRYADAIAARLGAHPPLALHEPEAGHLVCAVVPNVPYPSGTLTNPDGRPLANGGTVQADALGRLDAWPRLLTFLADQE